MLGYLVDGISYQEPLACFLPTISISDLMSKITSNFVTKQEAERKDDVERVLVC
jgi:hypothetical protein